MHRRHAFAAAALRSPPADAENTVSIPGIQGARHGSSLLGERVVTSGVVTAVAGHGVQVQDPEGGHELPLEPLMRRWWDHMADIMATAPGGQPLTRPLEPLFHLD